MIFFVMKIVWKRYGKMKYIQNFGCKVESVEDCFLCRYHYSLKMYTYERVRARNFARTWGFVQCSQAIPIAIGVPISGECASSLLLLLPPNVFC
jgi:hypothetical protein